MKKWDKYKSIKFYYRNVITQYLRFIIIYSLLWIWPNVSKILEFSNLDDPYWLILLEHTGIAATGIGNGIIWIWNLHSRYRDDNSHDISDTETDSDDSRFSTFRTTEKTTSLSLPNQHQSLK